MLANRYKKLLLFIAFFFTSGIISAQSNYIFRNLPGKWVKDSLPDFYIEEWKLTDSNVLEGYSYKIKNGEKLLLEELKISYIKDTLTYTALVFDQNNGEPVFFKLSTINVKNVFKFENPEHDFPQQITYSFINKEKLKISVYNVIPKQKGFELFLHKTE